MNNIPVQMIFVTDTDGKITPLKFKFKTDQDEIISYKIEQVIQKSSSGHSFGQTFICEIVDCDNLKIVCLNYHFREHKWTLIQNPSSIQFLMGNE